MVTRAHSYSEALKSCPQPFLQVIDLAEKATLGRNTPAYLSRELSVKVVL
jgi:hypothetical protein